nr:cardiotrophin-like cytokine factor 1 isoform X4 [Rattus norvegicus]
MPSLPPPPGGLGWYRRSLASPHHPPLNVVGGRGAPEALPSLLPPLPPTRGGLLQFVVTALHVRKKKVCRMSHTEKKNAKPREKNLRVGLADGIIKASPEPRLALPLRQPLGEEPRPAGPAPSPMDLRAGDSWGMLACLCTVLWHLPAVPALNRTGDPGPGPSIQKTYDLTRYLEHQLRSLAGTYLCC